MSNPIGKSLLDVMEQGDQDGMQTFDGVIEKMVRTGVVDARGSAALTPPTQITYSCGWATSADKRPCKGPDCLEGR